MAILSETDLNELLGGGERGEVDAARERVEGLGSNFPREGTWVAARWPVGLFPPENPRDILNVLVVATFAEKRTALILIPDVTVTYKVSLPSGEGRSLRTFDHAVITEGGGRFGVMVVPLSEVEFLEGQPEGRKEEEGVEGGDENANGLE